MLQNNEGKWILESLKFMISTWTLSMSFSYFLESSISSKNLWSWSPLVPPPPLAPVFRIYFRTGCVFILQEHSPSMETHLDAVRGLIKPRDFRPSASTSRARRSDAAMSDTEKQICFMLMPRAWFKVKEFRLE